MTASIKNKTIASFFWKLFERGGSAFAQLVVQVAMARILCPEDFGALAIMLVFINIGVAFVHSGLNTALVQSPNISDDDFSTVFWMSLVIAALLFLVIVVASPAIADFYRVTSLQKPLCGLALVLLIDAYNAIQIAWVQRRLEFKKTFVSTVVSVAVSGTIGIVSALMQMGLWALVIQQLLYQIVNCIVLAFQVPWRPRLVFRLDRAKVLFSFGWKLLFSSLISVGYQSLTDLIIGRQFSATQLGYVSQGKKYPYAAGSMLDSAIQPVMLSAVSRVQSDRSHVKQLIRRALMTSTFVTVPIMTLFAIEAEKLITIFLGEKWLPCLLIMQIYCFSYSLWPIHSANLSAINGVGRSDLFIRLEIIKTIVAVAILIAMVTFVGDINWIVAGFAATSIISSFINAYPNAKLIGYSYFDQLKDILPVFAVSFISGFVASLFAHFCIPLWALAIFQAVVMCLIYLGLSCLFHLEAFEYLLRTGKEFFGSYRR